MFVTRFLPAHSAEPNFLGTNKFGFSSIRFVFFRRRHSFGNPGSAERSRLGPSHISIFRRPFPLACHLVTSPSCRCNPLPEQSFAPPFPSCGIYEKGFPSLSFQDVVSFPSQRIPPPPICGLFLRGMVCMERLCSFVVFPFHPFRAVPSLRPQGISTPHDQLDMKFGNSFDPPRPLPYAFF